MEKLTAYFGFEARYVMYPFVALVLGACIKIVIGRYLHRWAKKTENKIDDLVIAYLDRLVAPLVLIVILYGLSHWLPISGRTLQYLHKGILICAILVLAFLTARLASSIVALAGEYGEGRQKYLQPFRTLSNVIFVLIAAALILRALSINITGEGIRLARIIGIIAGAYVISKIVSLAVAQMERMVETKGSTMSEAEKRARTLGKIINSAAIVIVVSVSIMMILSEFGMNIAPIITGAGIAGLAVGFGAQNLVRDVISGFFLILEDQIRVGDVARINGIGGAVEGIRLRTTVLRDVEGTVHIFPNGEIKQVANLTKEFSFSVIKLGISYKENVDEVMKLLAQIGEELRADPAYAPSILAPLEILGIDDFADSQVILKMRIKTLPLKQWSVGRELRRRIKNTFDARKIEMPFPQMDIHLGESGKSIGLPNRIASDKTDEKNA
ncbi:MAG TPA: mechanosensitive ion channel family protein [Acidobacteriota bacterium]|nr:mechanosensitive ion channel family protein [Acidobacteriota bacterium]